MQAEYNTNINLTLTFKQSQDNCLKSYFSLISNIQKTDWKSDIKQATNNFSLDQYKLQEMNILNTQVLYQKLHIKYQKMENQKGRIYWLQNQLKIFVWLCITASKTFDVPFESYSEKQIKILTQSFLYLNQNLALYQYKLLISPSYDHQWCQQQQIILTNLIKKYNFNGSWTTISKQLFLQSNNQYLRTGHSCRQKWQNHLNTKLVKGQWTLEQDYSIISHRLLLGKKWSLITKFFDGVRTEHMIKNRYKVILRKYSLKKEIRAIEQVEICKSIQHKLFLEINSKSNVTSIATAIQQELKNDGESLNNKNIIKFTSHNKSNIMIEEKQPILESILNEKFNDNQINPVNQESNEFMNTFFEKTFESDCFKNLKAESFQIPDDLKLIEEDFNQFYPIMEEPQCQILIL